MSPSEYHLVLTHSARKEVRALPTKIGLQVEHTLERLLARFREGQRPQDMRPLQGFHDRYRVDTGEYRILFDVDEAQLSITIFRVRHRKDVYRNL